MARRTYPLELVLTDHGPAELRNADDEVLWSSDSDDDFKEEIPDEFLMEEDFGDVLEYLRDSGILTQAEFRFFELDQWECNVETLDQDDPIGGDDDDDEEADET